MPKKAKKSLMRKSLIILALTFAGWAFSSVEVVFIEVRNAKGDLVVLEPGFPYAHVGVFSGGKTLHSHPKTGVAWANLNEMENIGNVKESFTVDIAGDLEQKVQNWIGKPYDLSFSWDDDKFYCSELVAKILGIPPEPMHFDSSLWPPSFSELEGKPGISPGKIYRKISGQDFSF